MKAEFYDCDGCGKTTPIEKTSDITCPWGEGTFCNTCLDIEDEDYEQDN